MKIQPSANPTAYRRGDGGFTLVELLIAMLILTVGLLGLLQSVNIAYEHNLRRQLTDVAAALAEDQLYLMRRDPSPESFSASTVKQAMGGLTKDFTVVRESEEIGASRKLKVSVRWSFKNVTSSHEVYTIRKL